MTACGLSALIPARDDGGNELIQSFIGDRSFVRGDRFATCCHRRNIGIVCIRKTFQGSHEQVVLRGIPQFTDISGPVVSEEFGADPVTHRIRMNPSERTEHRKDIF